MRVRSYGRHGRIISVGAAATAVLAGVLGAPGSTAASAHTPAHAAPESSGVAAPAKAVALGPQYSAVHVYVQPGQLEAFAKSWVGTFGGSYVKPFTTQLTPTPSSAPATQVFSPVALLSVFDFTTPVPYPFGQERTGWGVTDTAAATRQAQAAGAGSLVATLPDPIGHDSVIQFPGGIDTQLWHETTLSPDPFPALTTVPDNRVYVPGDTLPAFLKSYLAFTKGRVVLDDPHADGAQIDKPGTTYHRIAITSAYGNTVVISTKDGYFNYPFGGEVSGIDVPDLTATLAKARANGATVLWGPYAGQGGHSAMVRFPGGFVTEIHDGTLR
ncbi:glyoxalase [Streptomyces sp. NBC_00448]|uniref:glyoxalase n=1 Tax=Streptomyces sp. NBC_00448 TaxID=2903652 RepID=UPI002E219642